MATARPLFPAETLPNGWRRQWGPGCWAVRSEDGTWFYAYQQAGGNQARLIWRSFQGWQEITLEPVPTTRPTLYADPTGLYLIAGMDLDSTSVPTIYGPIPGYKPYPSGSDPRVQQLLEASAALATEVAGLRDRVERLSAQPAGGLNEIDRAALDWVREYRRVMGIGDGY